MDSTAPEEVKAGLIHVVSYRTAMVPALTAFFHKLSLVTPPTSFCLVGFSVPSTGLHTADAK